MDENDKTKKCTKCGAEKTLQEYSPDKRRSDGKACWCRKCIAEACAIARKLYPGRVEANRLRWRKANPQWEASYRERHRQLCKEWKIKNIEHVKEYRKRRRAINREKQKLWKAAHPEAVKATAKRCSEKRGRDPKCRLSLNIGTAMCHSLKNDSKASRHWESLVSFTMDHLKRHLERQFKPGMTWENYGRYGWHIDHIVPVAAFNFNSPEDIDFRRCWGLNNLQPLWAVDNLAKQAKLAKPFQPSLAIAI